MSGPLDGVLVVDLSRALAGPHAAMMLGDLGARVIKVENPDGGDDSRGWGPPFVDDTGSVADSGESTYFFSCNRNKESVTADLKSAEGKDLLTRLVRRADVLVENFRTGVLDRLGFSVEAMHELNPRLVVLSITGFGHDGPEGGRAGYDQIAQGEAGLMSLTGTGPDDPNKVGVPIGDLLAGMYGAYGAVAALHERDRTGRGTRRAHLAARQHRRRARLPGHPLHRRRRGALRPGQPPPLDLPLRPVPLRRRPAADRRRQRRALEAPGPGLRPAAGRARLRDQRRARPQPGGGQRGRRRRLRDVRPRGPAAEAGRGRRAGRRGAVPGPGLRLGADPVPGAACRGRARDGRPDHPARSAAALRRLRLPTSTPRRRRWASTTSRCVAGWTETESP